MNNSQILKNIVNLTQNDRIDLAEHTTDPNSKPVKECAQEMKMSH